MNPSKANLGRKQMATLDRLLASEPELVPSSGFAAMVMDRVRQEAAAPDPIPFPWKRALPGMFAAAIGLIWLLLKLAQDTLAIVREPVSFPLHASIAVTPLLSGAGWVAAALGVSLLSWFLPRRLIGRAGMA